MARHTQDREDLLRDATALILRVMLRVDFSGTVLNVLAGFRVGGAVSVYFDADPVYHFNTRSELRRAFVGEVIYKAELGKLVAWQPQRSATAVTMASRCLSLAEQQEFGARMLSLLDDLYAALRQQRFELLGQVPAEEDVIQQLHSWLAQLKDFAVAATVGVS